MFLNRKNHKQYCNRADRKRGRFITVIWKLLFLGVKIVYLVERTDLCKISKLVYGDKEIVTCSIASYRDRDSLCHL